MHTITFKRKKGGLGKNYTNEIEAEERLRIERSHGNRNCSVRSIAEKNRVDDYLICHRYTTSELDTGVEEGTNNVGKMNIYF